MIQQNNLKLPSSFFKRDALEVAPKLLGKYICRRYTDNTIQRFAITEIEVYRGEEDLACHASKGRTARTEVMYWEGGYIYVYLIYGMHLMLNIVTGQRDEPQAILIRGVNTIIGPGRVSKALDIQKDFNKQHVSDCPYLWLEDAPLQTSFKTDVRIGIDYAGEYWKNKPWRYICYP